MRGHDTSLATGELRFDGGPGCRRDVALYVPLVVLMLVKNLNAREMEAYLAENVVARVHWTSGRSNTADSGPLQHRSGLSNT